MDCRRGILCIRVGSVSRTVDASDTERCNPARHGQNERVMTVGRRNWLFADTMAGAHTSARLYSLLQYAKAN